MQEDLLESMVQEIVNKDLTFFTSKMSIVSPILPGCFKS